MTLLFAGPQLTMWWFAREAALAAATTGARAAATYGAPTGSGRQAAATYLAQLASGTISASSVTERADATTVTISVHVDVPDVVPLPGLHPAADVTVVRGRERFTTPGQP